MISHQFFKSEENSKVEMQGAVQKDPELAIIALDVLKNDNYFAYSKLTAISKIIYLKNVILNAYDQILKLHSHVDWVIVAWREYAITDPSSKSIDAITKKFLIEELRGLTKSCPKLIIIAGGTLIRKNINADKLEKIKSYYEDLQVIKKIEKELNQSKQFEKYEAALDSYIANVPTLNGIYFTELTNTTAVFFQGKRGSHNKVAPFDEHIPGFMHTNSFIDFDYVFKPGRKDKSSSPFFALDNGLNVVVEICREHGIGLAKKCGADKPIDIHVIASASISIIVAHLLREAKYGALHVDSMHEASFISSTAESHCKPLNAYRIDITKEQLSLVPIKRIYPLHFQLMDCFENLRQQLLESVPSSVDHAQLLFKKIQSWLPKSIPFDTKDYSTFVKKCDDEYFTLQIIHLGGEIKQALKYILIQTIQLTIHDYTNNVADDASTLVSQLSDDFREEYLKTNIVAQTMTSTFDERRHSQTMK